ncbi:MAG: four helix bundle protein [Verrucomicrobia bacterium]|nr:four helix bundle protein [Verrucomicrobiota bacterium]MCG2678456.1 four helix bundle protein [Kiritimatiellia bacterium]MBU4248059.1 four helix bundle protein [Verrucomicrobiota bacterium]MBU4290215.1 four helix bundle protein [Verrucomicrobiota bacterium]MBU4430228.1 four helix bundle protein [Verrucomicrobiota bacterium]
MADGEEKTREKKIRRVEDMPVYQMFYSLALEVEKASRQYPRDFLWLRTQSLRSSESVCANMTEGFYSQYSTEYLQSLYRCRREARETMTHIHYARDVKMLEKTVAESLLSQYEATLCQLSNLIAGIENKIRLRGKFKPGIGVIKEESADYQSLINHSY